MASPSPTSQPLPRLPLYDPALYPYYAVVKPHLPNTVDDQLYTTLRNIMLCLAAHGYSQMLPIVGALLSLSAVYTFLETTAIPWDVVFGELGKVDDSMVMLVTTTPYEDKMEITEVYQAYPRSREGGLSSQLIRASSIVALQHESPVKYESEIRAGHNQHHPGMVLDGVPYDEESGYQGLIDILDSGALKVGDRTDQFPAVYFTMDIGSGSTKMRRTWADPLEDNVTFIFSAALLKSPSWHTNGGGLYGRVDESSYDPITFHKLLFPDARDVGEIAFHHACPLSYLEAIVAPDHQVNDVKLVMAERAVKYPVISASEYQDGPYTRYLKGINEPLSFTVPPLSLAWYAFTADGNYASLNTIKKTLINFGHSQEQATAIIREYPIASLLIYLAKLNETTPRLTTPVVIHPPY